MITDANNQQGDESEMAPKRKRKPGYVDHELLRERAKDHIRRREWDAAIRTLNKTLEEPEDLPMGENFVPNKQVRHLFYSHQSVHHECKLFA